MSVVVEQVLLACRSVHCSHGGERVLLACPATIRTGCLEGGVSIRFEARLCLQQYVDGSIEGQMETCGTYFRRPGLVRVKRRTTGRSQCCRLHRDAESGHLTQMWCVTTPIRVESTGTWTVELPGEPTGGDGCVSTR